MEEKRRGMGRLVCVCEAVSNGVVRKGFTKKVTSEQRPRGGGTGHVAVGTASAKALRWNLLGMFVEAHLGPQGCC